MRTINTICILQRTRIYSAVCVCNHWKGCVRKGCLTQETHHHHIPGAVGTMEEDLAELGPYSSAGVDYDLRGGRHGWSNEREKIFLWEKLRRSIRSSLRVHLTEAQDMKLWEVKHLDQGHRDELFLFLIQSFVFDIKEEASGNDLVR